MNFQNTTQGLLIYLAMSFHLLAFVLLAVRRRRFGWAAYAAGFVAALGALLFRWWHAGHPPLQNMFEVFLVLGVLFFPLSVFCRRSLRTGGEAFDALLAVIILWPAGFVFNHQITPLPPALQSPLFIPHVLAYMLSYIFMAKAAFHAGARLLRGPDSADTGLLDRDESTYRLIGVGFPFMTWGLLLGAWWGKQAWGDYWNWDPKELWSLTTWLVYLGYFHLRALPGKKTSRAASLLALLGMLCVVLTLLWVNLAGRFAGLHSYAK